MPELYIAGKWTAPATVVVGRSGARLTAALVAEVDEADRADAAAAIEAARVAFDARPVVAVLGPERGRLLHRVADLLERDKAEIARRESLDTGKRLVESEYDVDDVAGVFRHYGNVAAEDAGRLVDTGRADVVSRVVHEPVGVCALITPWNYPLLQTSWKVAPALAAGNTFVLKPSELTRTRRSTSCGCSRRPASRPGSPTSSLGAGPRRRRAARRGPPRRPGVVHRRPETGKRIMAAAAATVKKVALELGGKNPNIVFADADLETALDFALTAVFLHSGQVCSAGARLVVEETIHDEFVDELVAPGRRIRLGGPFDEQAETGPLISRRRTATRSRRTSPPGSPRVRRSLRRPAPDDPALDDGHYYLPTVLDGCTPGMSVVAGGVLRPGPHRRDLHATRTTRSRRPTTASTAWPARCGPRTPARPSASPARLRMGTVWINDYHPYVPQAEWGGYKQSGIGRELGRAGLEEYRETKHVWHNVRPRRNAGSATARSTTAGVALVGVRAGTGPTRPTTSSSSGAAPPGARWPTG